MLIAVTGVHLPDTAEVSQIEDVVEVGRRRQHPRLGPLPQSASCRDQDVHHPDHLLAESTLLHHNSSSYHHSEVRSKVRVQEIVASAYRPLSAFKTSEINYIL